MKKVLMTMVLVLVTSYGVFAQGIAHYKQNPQHGEKILGIVSYDVTDTEYDDKYPVERTEENLYQRLLKEARHQYPEHPDLSIRNFTSSVKFDYGIYYTNSNGRNYYWHSYTYTMSGKAVYVTNSTTQAVEDLSIAIDKASKNIRSGSRFAIDKVEVSGAIGRDELTDQIVDVLLEKGFKVVAKEYLERLYKEQRDQQSGIYNENTTVQENNFSAVGYFVNVRYNSTSCRVQVVNVSTGEYEGNATVNF